MTDNDTHGNGEDPGIAGELLGRRRNPALDTLNIRPLLVRFRAPATLAHRRVYVTGELVFPNPAEHRPELGVRAAPAASPELPLTLTLRHFVRTPCDGWELHGFRIGPDEQMIAEGPLAMMMLEDPEQSPAALGTAAPGQVIVACVSHTHPAYRALEFHVQAVGTLQRGQGGA